MQRLIVAARLAQRPPGRSQQFWPCRCEMAEGGVAARYADAAAVWRSGGLVRRVVGAGLDRLRVDRFGLPTQILEPVNVIAMTGPQAGVF